MFENFIFPYSLFLVFIIYLFICLPILVTVNFTPLSGIFTFNNFVYSPTQTNTL